MIETQTGAVREVVAGFDFLEKMVPSEVLIESERLLNDLLLREHMVINEENGLLFAMSGEFRKKTFDEIDFLKGYFGVSELGYEEYCMWLDNTREVMSNFSYISQFNTYPDLAEFIGVYAAQNEDAL